MNLIKHASVSGSPHRRAAFSLVETVLALGIMALAITALLGLLPHGIEMSRKAANAAAETRIVDTLLGQLNNVSFTALDTLDKKEFHFDDQGVAVDGSSDMSQSTYFVRILIGAGTAGLTLPGPGAKPEPWMRKIQIQIVQTPLLRFNFENAPPRSYSTVPVVLAASAP